MKSTYIIKLDYREFRSHTTPYRIGLVIFFG
jgi:hypothetical protein